MKKRLLLVDDDVALTELVSEFLRKNDFDVDVVHDGHEAIARISNDPPDLVILDIMLPGADGLTVCRLVRAEFEGPILMLTALSEDVDEVAGLELGADDYLSKPVRPRVLLARVRALFRRRSDASNGLELATNNRPSPQISTGPLTIDSSTRRAYLDETDLELTTSEFDLLWTLAQRKGQVIDREALHNEILRTPFDGLDRTIDLRISRLRRKLGEDPKHPQLLITIRSKGYMLAELDT